MDQLNMFSKWNYPFHKVQVGDIVCLTGEQSSPSKWPFAWVENVHPEQGDKVQVVTIRTSKGMYNHPVMKVVPLVNKNPVSLQA